MHEDSFMSSRRIGVTLCQVTQFDIYCWISDILALKINSGLRRRLNVHYQIENKGYLFSHKLKYYFNFTYAYPQNAAWIGYLWWILQLCNLLWTAWYKYISLMIVQIKSSKKAKYFLNFAFRHHLKWWHKGYHKLLHTSMFRYTTSELKIRVIPASKDKLIRILNFSLIAEILYYAPIISQVTYVR